MQHLITTKLRVPPPTSTLVERPELVRQLTSSLNTKLVLVSAPAGAGKSTLLGQWLQHQRRPAAWLSLEAGENDLGQFLLYLISAVQRVQPQVGRGLVEQVRLHGAPQAEPLVAQLLNELADSEEPLIIVLDDFHVITDARVHAANRFLLEHLPPGVRLAVGTRTDPPFELGKLRARGQLLEIRSDNLRFGLEETGALLNDKFELELSSAAVARLEARTEGWVAGLQLAALSLAGRQDKEAFVAAFAGSHRHLADFLFSEVFGQQPPERQRFLQRTSVLTRFTARLCEAVAQEPQGADMLRRLEADNLFLISLDEARTWFRYHHLFAEFLRHRLTEAEPGKVTALHGRASAWFEAYGSTDEAIAHAFEANDLGRAAALIENVAFTLGVTWDNARLIRYAQRFPQSLLSAFPRLCIYYVWALTNTGQLDALATVAPLLEQSEPYAAQPHTVRACVLTLRAYARLRHLDFVGTARLCRDALAELNPLTGTPSDEERWLLVATTNLMAYGLLHSDLRSAERVYPKALQRSEAFGNAIGTINGFARLGRVQHHLGRLRAAFGTLNRGLDTLERWQLQESFARRDVNAGELHLNLARVFYEWNRLDDAEAELRRAQALNRFAQFPPVQALAHKTAFQLELTRGELAAAQASLDDLDCQSNAVHPENLLHRQIFEVTAMELRLLLAAEPTLPGRQRPRLIREVAGWLEQRAQPLTDAPTYASEGPHYIEALLLAQTRPTDALSRLGRLIERAEHEGRTDDLIRYLVLRALTASARAQSFADLERALALAEPEGYRRLFLDHGLPLHSRLAELANERPAPYLESLLTAFASQDHANARSALPLSARQRAILQLLADGRSNKEIAKQLNLSPNTVKWYVRSLYEILGVNTRVKALHRAKKLGLYG